MNNSLKCLRLSNVEVTIKEVENEMNQQIKRKKQFRIQATDMTQVNESNPFKQLKVLYLNRVKNIFDMKKYPLSSIEKLHIQDTMMTNNNNEKKFENIIALSDQLQSIKLQNYKSSQIKLTITNDKPVNLMDFTSCVVYIQMKEGVHPQLNLINCDDLKIVSLDEDNRFFEQLSQLTIKHCREIVFNGQLTNLKKLKLNDVRNVQLTAPSLKNVKINNCSSCHFNFNLKQPYIEIHNMNNSTIECSWITETFTFTMEESVNCHIIPQQDNANIIMNNCFDIDMNNQVNYNSIVLFESTIITQNIITEKVTLRNVESLPLIDWKKVKEINLIKFKDAEFSTIFESCEKVSLIESANCDIVLTEEEQKNIKEIVSSKNINCTIPSIVAFKDIEDFIIDLSENEEKENVIHSISNRNIIIRNANETTLKFIGCMNCSIIFDDCHKIDIFYGINSLKDITFTKCLHVDFTIKYNLKVNKYGNLCTLPIEIENMTIKDSQYINLIENLVSYHPKKLLIIENSIVNEPEVNMNYSSSYLTIERIELKNMRIPKVLRNYFTKTLVLNQCILNEKNQFIFFPAKKIIFQSISQPTKVSLVDRNNFDHINLRKIKKIIFMNCSQLKIETDRRDIDFELNNCSNMKVKDLNQLGEKVKLIDCENVEEWEEEENNNERREFGDFDDSDSDDF